MQESLSFTPSSNGDLFSALSTAQLVLENALSTHSELQTQEALDAFEATFPTLQQIDQNDQQYVDTKSNGCSVTNRLFKLPKNQV